MIPLSNIHSHTTYADGCNSAEEMVFAAIRKGFHTLGFSEHKHADYDACSMSLEQEPRYRAEIRQLKAAYADRIHILLGCEHDWLSPMDASEYEYFIESVHYVPFGGALFGVDHSRERFLQGLRELFSGDPYLLCREYFRTVCDSCKDTVALVLGHIELVMKFNERRDLFDDCDPRYLRYALEAAECAARTGKLIEINTGAIARGYRTEPNPGRGMLSRIRECGGRIILTSDCHNADYLTSGFEQAAALAKACGFRTAWEVRGANPEEYEL